MRKNHALALILLLAFVAVLFVFSFLGLHADDHDCAGLGCSICAEIKNAEQICKALSHAFAAVVFVGLLIISLVISLSSEGSIKEDNRTLIGLKVELLN